MKRKKRVVPTHKTCNRCGKSLPLYNFFKHKTGKYGLHGTCKECIRLRDGRWRRNEKTADIEARLARGLLKCTWCKQEKPLSEFHKHSKNLRGYNSRCKECMSETRNVTSERRRRQDEMDEIYARGIIRCTQCGKEKPLEAFNKNMLRKRGYSTECKTCVRDRQLTLEAANIANGLCRCGRARWADLWCCEKCYWRNLGSRYKGGTTLGEQLKNKYTGTCAYTGRELQIGITAHVDHRNPRTRFPEQISDINNLEWTHKQINEMKSNMTYDEFVAACREVVEYHDAKAQC